MSAARAEREGVKPLARITGYAASGVEPKWVMMAPVGAVRMLNEKLGVGIDHHDLIEINEPFAVASIAVNRELETDPAKTNVNGGAVALGHPIGATGARMVTTLLHALADRGGKTGLASLCLGGGNAVALSLEML
jgi:acetyl-CoA C-acetyltransferase